jgi:hypothetical protein
MERGFIAYALRNTLINCTLSLYMSNSSHK